MAHRCGFTETALRGRLIANGFATVATMRRPSAFDLWAVTSVCARAEDVMQSLAEKHFPSVR